MAGFFSLNILQTALEVGVIYALVALALFVSFSILNIADLSTDGCFTLGCAVGATLTIAGHPLLALPAAMAAGAASGFLTAFLQTKLGVASILAGIVVNTGLYTVNLAVMGFSSNLSIFGKDTIFSLCKGWLSGSVLSGWYKLVPVTLLVLLVLLFLAFFLRTRLGLSIRATGDSPAMVSASSINPSFTVTVGLCLSNSLTGLAGCLIAQYNKSCDINLGSGMVTIALASLIIGESIFGRGGIPRRLLGVVAGSCIYRFIVAIALRLNVSSEYFKLVSAVIVAVAIAAPRLRARLRLERARRASKKAFAREEGREC